MSKNTQKTKNTQNAKNTQDQSREIPIGVLLGTNQTRAGIIEEITKALLQYVTNSMRDKEAFDKFNEYVASLFGTESVLKAKYEASGSIIPLDKIVNLACADQTTVVEELSREAMINNIYALYRGLVEGTVTRIADEESQDDEDEEDEDQDQDNEDEDQDGEEEEEEEQKESNKNASNKKKTRKLAITEKTKRDFTNKFDGSLDLNHARVAIGIDKVTAVSKNVNDKSEDLLIKGIDFVATTLKKAVNLTHTGLDKAIDMSNTGAHIANDASYKTLKYVIDRPATNLDIIDRDDVDLVEARKLALEMLKKKNKKK